MSDLGNIVKKEVKELLTIKTLVPILALALVFRFMGQSLGNVTEKAEEKPVVGIIDGDNSALSRSIVEIFENRSKIVYFSDNVSKIQEGMDQLEENQGVALIKIPLNFGENIRKNRLGNIEVRWVLKGTGIMESIPTEVVNAMIQAGKEKISRALVQESENLDPNVTLQPVRTSQITFLRGKEFKGVTPSSISQALSMHSTLIPMVIMIIILMSGSQVIQSMGMEKSNKTLETLLTLPVKRSRIAIGKIIGSAVVGLLFAGIYMGGFGYYMQSIQTGTANLAETGLTLGLLDYALLTISLFLTILAGLSICMLMGTFAQDYKSAQTLMFPLIILVFIPFFLSMFKSFHTLPSIVQGLVFLIPFSHPMIAIGFLMFNEYTLVVAGVIYVTIFIVGMMALVSYVFEHDTLITGRFEVEWIDRLFSFIFRRGEGSSKE